MGSQAIDAGAFGKALAITGSANIQPASQWPFLNQSGVAGTNLNGSQIYSGSGGAIDVILADTVGVQGVVTSLSLISGGTGYTAGAGQATTSASGLGTGLSVTTTVVGGVITVGAIAAAGTGYRQGDIITIAGGSGGQFRINVVDSLPTAAQKVTFTAVPAGTVLPVSVDYVLNTSVATGMVALR